MDDQKGLSGREISSIVEACAKSGVVHFRYGALSISFSPAITEIIATPPPGEIRYQQIPTADSNPQTQTPPETDDSVDDIDDMLNNPLAWERRLLEEVR